MEEALGNYGEGVAKALVGKLGQLLSEEYRLLRRVRDGVVHLRDDVAIMNALLRMFAEADDGAVNHFVREWMKQVRELAYDGEDCIDLYKRRISCAPRGALGAWHLFVTLRARHRLASDIQALRARALDVSERRTRYGVDSQALRPSVFFAPGAAVASSSSANVLGAANDADQLVGIENQVKCLSAKVKSSEDNGANKKLKVFSIVGFGGLGKTTLAIEVARRLEEEFVCQAHVSVSQAFDASKDISGLLNKILQQVKMVMRGKQKRMQEESMGDIGAMDVQQLTSKLRDFLEDKRPNNEFKSYFNNNIYRVKHLELKDSEKIFISRVFGPNNDCPKELEKAKDNILKKCGGLPLVIVSVASLLARYKSPGSIGMWDRICNSIGSQIESNPTLEGMRHLITLSYSHLPHHLKACMMYLAIFPEDYLIGTDRLLQRWIAEDLVPKMRGLTSQESAETCFEELLSRNMIKPSKVEYDGKVVVCCLHDMMLEVIVSKSLEQNFASLVGGQGGGMTYDSVRRLSIQGDDPRSLVPEMGVRHVRSLSTFRPHGHRRMLDRLQEFILLRVLDLQDCKDLLDQDMKVVCRLFLLRYLNLNNTNITVVPSQIGDLLHLQTLWLYGTLLTGVPDSVIKLENLENLGLSNRDHWWVLLRLPRGLGKMKSLNGLTRLELSEDDAEFAREIGDLVQLRKLGIVLNCDNCYDGQVLKELASSIGKIYSLHEFGVEDMSRFSNNMKFLHGIRSPPLLIRYLKIGGTIDKFPEWVESLTHLTHIELWWIDLHSDQIYGVLWKLPSLLKISLDRSCCKDEKLVARTAFKFQVLREMFFVPYGYGEIEVPRVLQFEEGAMEKLERLVVRFENVERSLVGVENLTSLKQVQLEGRRDNRALHSAVEQLKTESNSRQESNRFKVVLKYD